jgi:hypothetical protein
MKMPSMRNAAQTLLKLPVLAALLVGVLIGALAVHYAFPSKGTGQVLFQSTSTYQYIDPLLACDVGSSGSFSELNGLNQALTSEVNADIHQGKATRVSVYFRSLKDAHWFVIHPEQTYQPASMLKVLAMMAFYKESRDLEQPGVLQKQIAFQASPNPEADDSPGAVIPHLVNHQLYTVQDVIQQMIVYSDNDALVTLTDNFDPETVKSLSEMFTDLQITSPLKNETEYQMPVEQYAMIFRVLYGSTYLSRALSEQALGLLAQAQYHGALAGGVPADVTVAHKFGIAAIPATATAPARSQLHDCGIVYYAQSPYLLCVMTEGKDYLTLESVIRNISATTYAGVQKLNPQR